jgi:chromosomal replication initiator protein
VISDSTQTLWPGCLDVLAQELPEQQFNTWIKPLSAQTAPDGSRLTLLVANRFKLDWIRAQYATRIVATLEQLAGQPVQLELALAPRTASASRPSPLANGAALGSAPSLPAQRRASPPAPRRARPPRRAPQPAEPALTFDVLVEGSANRMARAAALHVAGAPGGCTTRCSSTAAWAWARPT